LRPLADEVRLVLGGHEGPFENLESRIDEIRDLYEQRLEHTLKLTRQPATLAQVAAGLFKEPKGYHRLLALEEAGAYLEYLEQRGQVGLEDLNALNDPERGAAYVRI
jgi:hypothetical protein